MSTTIVRAVVRHGIRRLNAGDPTYVTRLATLPELRRGRLTVGEDDGDTARVPDGDHRRPEAAATPQVSS